MTPGKVENLHLAWNLAVSKYLGPALKRRLGMDVKELFDGIVPGLLLGVRIMATAAGVGFVAGAVTGLLFPPSEAVTPFAGAALGLLVAQFILTIMGLKFIYDYVAARVGVINHDMHLGCAYAYEKGEIDRGAYYLAEALATLFAVIVEAIVIAIVMHGFKVLRQSKYGVQMESWVSKNWETLRERFFEKIKGRKTPYLERNSAADPHEREIGAWMHELSENGRLRDVARVEEGVKPTGSSKATKAGKRNPDPDYDFVDHSGKGSKADLYEPEFDKNVDFDQKAKKEAGYDPAKHEQFVLDVIGKDLSRKMGDAKGSQLPDGTIIVEFGRKKGSDGLSVPGGATVDWGVAQAKAAAEWFFKEPNHRIRRAIFIKNKTILVDRSR